MSGPDLGEKGTEDRFIKLERFRGQNVSSDYVDVTGRKHLQQFAMNPSFAQNEGWQIATRAIHDYKK